MVFIEECIGESGSWRARCPWDGSSSDVSRRGVELHDVAELRLQLSHPSPTCRDHGVGPGLAVGGGVPVQHNSFGPARCPGQPCLP